MFILDDTLKFDSQPIHALQPLLLAVEGMVEVTATQLQDLLQAKNNHQTLEKKSMERLKNIHTQRQSHIGLYKLQCERWKTEQLVQYQKQYLTKLESALTELEKINQKVLEFVRTS